MTGKTVIVTGATGLIGSAVVDLLSPECDVHCISRSASTKEGVTWHTIDLSLSSDLSILPERADAIIYLAQSEFFRDFPERSLDIFQINTANLLRMLDYARRAKVKTFVYGSSGGVYGTGDTRMTEESSIRASGSLGFYLSTKLCSEVIAQNFAELFGVVILRYFFVYGPGQRRDMLIPRLVQRIREGAPIGLQGYDGIRINPAHVSDAALATLRAIDLPSSMTINVAGPDVLNLRQIGDSIGAFVGRKPIYTVDESAHAGSLTGDIARMSEMLTSPKVRFIDGIKSMI